MHWLMSTVAFAEQEPNSELVVALALVRAGGADHRWGVELGASELVALGDHCSWSEADCRDGPLWPLGGARAALRWRGRDRLGVTGELLAGVGLVEMHQFGFLPDLTGLAAIGADGELGRAWQARAGGDLAKSLSYTVSHDIPGGTSSRVYGLAPLSLTAGVRAPLGGGAPQLAVGLASATRASDYE